MKIKKLTAALLSVIMVAAMCGCSSKKVDVDALESDVIKNVKFDVELEQINSIVLGVYFDLPEGVTGDVYRGSSVCPDQLAVFVAEDEDGAQAAKQMVKDSIASLKDTFSDYETEQLPKINNAVLKSSGKYVIFCITNDYKNAAKIIDKYLK